MFQFVKKIRVHGLILIGVVVYLLLAPVVYRNLFIKVGVPIQYSGELPAASNNIVMAVDSFDSVTYEGDVTRDLEGWAYLRNEPDQSKYERFIVLQSKSCIYFFSVSPVKRTDLHTAFSNLGLNLIYSGFRAFISEEHIKPGTYQVGILFKSSTDGTVFYSISSNVIRRTPNKIILSAIEPLQTIEETVYRGTETSFDQPLPKPNEGILSYLDTLSNESLNGVEVMRLSGWAFLQDEQDQTFYERFIILYSDHSVLYFPVNFVERPDVQDAFNSLGLNLELSGFTTLISKDALTDESYEIGVLFQHKTQKTLFFAKTYWLISRQSGQYSLERKQ
jgi:hypothetical protein